MPETICVHSRLFAVFTFDSGSAGPGYPWSGSLQAADDFSGRFDISASVSNRSRRCRQSICTFVDAKRPKQDRRPKSDVTCVLTIRSVCPRPRASERQMGKRNSHSTELSRPVEDSNTSSSFARLTMSIPSCLSPDVDFSLRRPMSHQQRADELRKVLAQLTIDARGRLRIRHVHRIETDVRILSRSMKIAASPCRHLPAERVASTGRAQHPDIHCRSYC